MKRGSKRPKPLTPHIRADILAALARGEPAKAIAEQFGVGESRVNVLLIGHPDIALSRKKERLERLRSAHRSTLLKVRKARPGMTLRTFRHAYSVSYRWLARNDRDWLGEALPINVSGPVQRSINLRKVEQKDERLAESIKALAKQICDASDPYQRVTRSILAKLSGHRGIETETLSEDTYPKTLKALRTIVETPEKFIERKMVFVLNRERQFDRMLTADELLALAGISKRKWHQHRAKAVELLNREYHRDALRVGCND